jgi:hypothetical protein
VEEDKKGNAHAWSKQEMSTTIGLLKLKIGNHSVNLDADILK